MRLIDPGIQLASHGGTEPPKMRRDRGGWAPSALGCLFLLSLAAHAQVREEPAPLIPDLREPLLPGRAVVRSSGAVPSRADSTAASVPAGYELVFSQDFDAASGTSDFRLSDPTAWRIGNSGNPALELHRQSQYKPPVRSPLNLALLDQFVVGDFVLEADLLQTGREYGHRDMCLIFGFQDPAHFYYVHLATTPDDHAHNIFIVNDAPRTKIANRVSNGVDWGRDSWHKVRIERTVEDGTIQVFFDDPAKPIMVATDRTFQQGYVGFGSFDDTGKIDHVRLWAPQVEKRALKFFEAKH